MLKTLLLIIFFGFIFNSSFIKAQTWAGMLHSPSAETICMEEFETTFYIGGQWQYQSHLPGTTQSNMNRIASWNGISFDTLGNGINQGLGGGVMAMEEYNGKLILAGIFNDADGLLCNNIVSWDGTNFDTLASGIIGQKVLALKVFDGNLYAAGIFTSAGGISVSNIAKWDGTSWSNVGTGINNQIWALETYNNELYAGGYFSMAGGGAVSNIARWNGTNWNDVNGGPNHYVTAMKVYQNTLFIGGSFYQINGNTFQGVARWDGSNWFSCGAGLHHGGTVHCFVPYAGRLVIGGSFTEIGGIVANHIAQWDGTSWSSLGIGNELWHSGMDVNSAISYQDTLFVAGTFTSIFNISDTTYYMAKYYNPLVTSVEFLDNQDLQIYPNPTTESFSIKSSVPINKIHLYSIDGKRIKTWQNSNDFYGLDNLTPGLYFIHIMIGESSVIRTLILK
jgi:hypothetical protein